MSDKSINSVLRRLHDSGIAKRDELQGCSQTEIQALEDKYNIQLPSSYNDYLKMMGHKSGRLFTSDHMAVFYPFVLDLTFDFRQERLEEQTAKGDPYCPLPPDSFELPQNSLLIASRLDASWEFIHCAGQDDSAVWYFDETDWKITQSHSSLWLWLECWCGIAENAIKSGYFNLHPHGTTP